jgi:hypothetical protein
LFNAPTNLRVNALSNESKTYYTALSDARLAQIVQALPGFEVAGALDRLSNNVACYIVSIHKWLFSLISLLGGNFNSRHINHMPAVKISARLKLDQNISFLDGDYLKLLAEWCNSFDKYGFVG